eukprot:SAG25_NODE_1231_length_3554_cov_14.316932_3_plen_69_part_00
MINGVKRLLHKEQLIKKAMNKKFDQVEEKADQMQEKIGSVDDKVDQMACEMTELKELMMRVLEASTSN